MSNPPTFEQAYGYPPIPLDEQKPPTFEEAYGGVIRPVQPQQGVMGAVSEALKAQPAMTADALTNPVTQAKALPYIGGATGAIAGTTLGGMPGMKFGASLGNIGGNLLADAALASYGKSEEIPPISSQIAQGALSLAGDAFSAFTKVPESLKQAGIDKTTLTHMYPGGVSGQPPGDWMQAVEKQLQSKGVLGKTGNETWKLMVPKANSLGARIGEINDIIGQATPEALQVDAQTALAPLAQEAKSLGGGIFSAGKVAATPYEEATQALMQTAKAQGGKLTLDNIDNALDQAGKLMNGGEAAREEFGPVYGKLASVRDNIIQGIATQSGNPALATELLEKNAEYSTYLRFLPSIEKHGIGEALKEGISQFKRYGGPLVTKVAAGVGVYDELQKTIGKYLGTSQ